jgi:hypothetical protein
MIKQIIEELSDYNQSLVNPLLKAKVIAKRLGNETLINWIDKELNGYSPEENLPDYRIASAISNCDIQQGYRSQNNTPIPLSLIQNETLRSIFTDFPLIQSVVALEALVNDPSGDTLAKPFPADFSAFVTSEIKKAGVYIQVSNIVISTHRSSINQTLTGIRNKFLDIMLEFEQEFSDKDFSSLELVEKEKLNNQVTIIMKQYNIENTGDASSINLGDNNQINIAQGENIDQQILLKEEEQKIQELIDLIKEFHSKVEFEEKSDSEIELHRLENQLKKEKPNKTIIKSSLETIKSLAINVATSALTGPIVSGITELIKNWA